MGLMKMSILSVKVLLISAGVASLAMGIRSSVPVAVDGIPVVMVWSIVLSWLKPPYLYIIVNAMIITIAASSRFHQRQSEPSVPSEHLISAKTPPPLYYESLSAEEGVENALEKYTAAGVGGGDYESEDTVVEVKPMMVNGSILVIEDEEVVAEAKDVPVVDSTLTYNSPLSELEDIAFPELQLESLLPVREKPLVSSRLGHLKPIRTSPEGLRVARPKKQETLESIWKRITEGHHVPHTRHLKKSDTWEHHVTVATTTPPADQVPKSETFKERTNNESPPSTASSRIQKEPSLSKSELNRRVEAFIEKFSEEMRLQRQESLNQCKEMIKLEL